MAGRVADGIILQFADPALIEWCMGFVKEGATSCGARSEEHRSHGGGAGVGFGRFECRARPRALVSGAGVESRDGFDSAIQAGRFAACADFVTCRIAASYDYQHHCEVGSDNADFVSDEVIERFCLIGPAEAHKKKLRALEAAGVTQFNIYLMCGDEEQTLVDYQREVLPEFLGATLK